MPHKLDELQEEYRKKGGSGSFASASSSSAAPRYNVPGQQQPAPAAVSGVLQKARDLEARGKFSDAVDALVACLCSGPIAACFLTLAPPCR